MAEKKLPEQVAIKKKRIPISTPPTRQVTRKELGLKPKRIPISTPTKTDFTKPREKL